MKELSTANRFSLFLATAWKTIVSFFLESVCSWLTSIYLSLSEIELILFLTSELNLFPCSCRQEWYFYFSAIYLTMIFCVYFWLCMFKESENIFLLWSKTESYPLPISGSQKHLKGGVAVKNPPRKYWVSLQSFTVMMEITRHELCTLCCPVVTKRRRVTDRHRVPSPGGGGSKTESIHPAVFTTDRKSKRRMIIL